LEKGIIEVAPLAFMRGRTLNDSFVILDEAQNTTSGADEDVPHAAGVQLQAVITGDVTQDRPCRKGKKSGLVEASGVCGKIEGIGVMQFGRRTWYGTTFQRLRPSRDFLRLAGEVDLRQRRRIHRLGVEAPAAVRNTSFCSLVVVLRFVESSRNESFSVRPRMNA